MCIEDSPELHNSEASPGFNYKYNTNRKDGIFNIRPFNLECSTEATTSQSTRKPDSSENKTNFDDTMETIKFHYENVQMLNEQSETPKIKAALMKVRTKADSQPLKIKLKSSKTNLNKIKLKFTRKA